MTLITAVFLLTAATNKQTATTHFVEPGDTWAAIAGRYGLTTTELQAANPHPNPNYQPPIGSSVIIPRNGDLIGPNGRLVRLMTGGTLSPAARNRLNPWRLVLENGLTHPYHPLTYQLLYLPGTTPLKELPPGFSSLEISANPPQPGRAIGFRGLRQTAEPLTIALNGRQANAFNNNTNFVALASTGAFLKPGDYHLDFRVGNNPIWSQPLRFIPGQWEFSQLTLTGDAAAIDQASIQQERERLFAIWNIASPAPQWSTPFQLPIESYLNISSAYGARRSYNGGPYSSYHEGVDFSAYGGTPVYAPAAGTVVIAERLYVRGGAVIIDHGLGIYSGYYHLSEVVAQVGELVQPGQLIGNVGTTGLSTGNHLHWDLLVNGTWVDAAAWHDQDLACWLLTGWGTPCPTQ